MARKANTRRKTKRKVAVVTGGGSGLGRDCANRLTRDGFSVAVIGRRANRLKARRGEKLHPYVCDVAEADEVDETVRAILGDLGRIDVVVNSAGVIRVEPVDAITQENMRYTIDINLLGTINICVACIPALKKTKSSTSAPTSRPPLSRLSRLLRDQSGVDSFSKALALELAPHGIRVNVVTQENMRYTIDINLLGTINICVACIPALKKTKGSIVNLSSNVADRPFPGSAVYSATKGGVDSFSKALALELAPHGIRVNVVSPALVRSEIYTSSGMDEETYRQLLVSVGKLFPLGRSGEPSDVSELISYLVSERASWMTAEVIVLDGGSSVTGPGAPGFSAT